MPVNPVGLGAGLRAWHSAGLSLLYLPHLDAAALLARPAPARSSPARFASARREAEGESVDDYQVGNARPAPARREAERRETPAAERPAAPAAEAPAPPAAHIFTEAALKRPLPEAWLEAAQKVKAAPVVWSYKELGEDMLGRASAERRAALQKLIRELGLVAGTSSFLPVVLPGRPQDGSEAWCFAQILARTGGKVVVLLGREALDASQFSGFGPGNFEEKIVDGRLVLCLPGFAELLADEALFGATRSFLRSAFAKIKIL